MEEIIFKAIHSLALQSNWLDLVGIILAKQLGYFLVLLVLVILFFEKDRRRRLANALFIILSVLIARGLIAEVIQFFFFRSRPFVALNFTPLIEIANTAALPSGHATFYFALATSVYLTLNKRLGFWLLCGATFISLARVFVGVHWVSDIVLGAAIGILTPYLIKFVLQRTVSAPSLANGQEQIAKSESQNLLSS